MDVKKCDCCGEIFTRWDGEFSYLELENHTLLVGTKVPEHQDFCPKCTKEILKFISFRKNTGDKGGDTVGPNDTK